MEVSIVEVGEFLSKHKGWFILMRGYFFIKDNNWISRFVEIRRKCSSFDFNIFKKKSFVPQNSFTY